ncbi:heavy metal translocating P-type ATPase [Corynebacterium sphenisci]|uniref:heavy metal translocating P-type ATPase n=1 Tax=Corynebacterium sphenisci TaxID=191493 RepID=UPI0026E0E522|nr:cation-translocating P-type ATPase [Corynebacterium sphenisci]MDO5731524.1 cation-translocating P-type ATPase [Corynebacterium sphenisci]
MTCGCGEPCAADAPAGPVEERLPWYRDRAVLVPVASGVALVAGLLLDRAGAAIPAQVAYWAALLLGGSTFIPGTLRRFAADRKPGVGLLMTISAIGAVALGHVAEAAMLAFLFSIAEALEDRAMDRARAGLRGLLELVPDTAEVRRGLLTQTIPAAEIAVGDTLLVRPGDRIATDGVVRVGAGSVDASAITGESIPVAVGPGDEVRAGSINGSAALEVEAANPGADNSLTAIVALVEQAQAEKGDRARMADRLARPLVPAVIVVALAVAVLGAILGDPAVWVTRALVVLVAASPCALAISVPVTVISGIGAASRFGVIVKSGAAFERLGGIRHVALDKTGTLTANRPVVERVRPVAGGAGDRVLALAAALERRSSHPLATAIVAAADAAGVGDLVAEEVEERPGTGVAGVVDGAAVEVGNPRHLAGGLPADLAAELDELEAAGMTVVALSVAGAVAGVIGVRDNLRAEAAEAVAALHAADIRVSMLTGDNAAAAAALGAEAGIDDVRAALRPEQKSAAVRELSAAAPTAMIGDGVNDAPALAAAEVGIAMGATGSDAAIESADVAFTGHDLRLIPRALAHARRCRSIITQNLVISALIVVVLPPLAVTGVLGLGGIVLIHEAAEVLVIINGLRAARARDAA